MMMRKMNTRHPTWAASIGLGISYILASGVAMANPELDSFHSSTPGSYEDVANGKLITNLNQSKTVINWNSFNIAEGKTVTFNMNNPGDSVLNLINDSQASLIAGSIVANGQLFLVNVNGINFTQGSTVNASSFVASSLDINGDKFLAGEYNFFTGSNKGAIINSGTIKAATGGTVALIGHTVINQGKITASVGKVIMKAGEAMTMTFDNNGFMQFAVTQELASNILDGENAVSNEGEGNLKGQEIILEAHVAANIFTNAVNHSGFIEAQDVAVNDGNGNISLIGEGGAILVTADAKTYGNLTRGGDLPPPGEPLLPPVSPPPAPPTAPPLTEGGGTDGSTENGTGATDEIDGIDINERALNASALDPTQSNDLAAISNSSLGLFNVEAPGIKLPADQIEEGF